MKVIEQLAELGLMAKVLTLGDANVGPHGAAKKLEGVHHYANDINCTIKGCACETLRNSPVSGGLAAQQDWFTSIEEHGIAGALSTYMRLQKKRVGGGSDSDGDENRASQETNAEEQFETKLQALLDLYRSVPSVRSSDEAKAKHPGRTIYLATVHQSKGDEFEHVYFHTDLPPKEKVDSAAKFFNNFTNADVIYVAMTRAQQSLHLNGDWYQAYSQVMGSVECYTAGKGAADTICEACQGVLADTFCALRWRRDSGLVGAKCVGCLREEQAEPGGVDEQQRPDALELLHLMEKVAIVEARQ
eukprot:TRINITY_DN8171_c0_g1_i2.p1 TRINITY_DN8171_c0_g1~~TRINITY_DN8171_c0_g1_i2.p1  ORF type:complete len:302 (+),score=64.10 TRINITY_DN8171_c0_g1_i2:714-1619(+)